MKIIKGLKSIIYAYADLLEFYSKNFESNMKHYKCHGCRHLDRNVCILQPGNHCIRQAEDFFELNKN